MATVFDSKIKFDGNIDGRDEALSFVDVVFKEKGEAEFIGDTTGGLNELSKRFNIQVVDDDGCYTVIFRNQDETDPEDKATFEVDKQTRILIALKKSDNEPSDQFDNEDEDFLSDI